MVSERVWRAFSQVEMQTAFYTFNFRIVQACVIFTLVYTEDPIQHFIADTGYQHRQLKQQVDLKWRDSCMDELLYKQIIKYAV